MRTDELLEIVKRQMEQSDVKFDGKPSWNGDYRPWFHGEQAKKDYTVIFSELPAIIKDHLAMTELLDRLLGVVAEQQIEIARLSSEIESVRKAYIEVKAQENMNDIINKLTDKGCDISNALIDIKLEASSSYATEDGEHQQEDSSENKASEKNITAGIGNILNQLNDLHFGYKSEASEARRTYKELTKLRKRDVKRRDEVHMHIVFGSITGSKTSKWGLTK